MITQLGIAHHPPPQKLPWFLMEAKCAFTNNHLNSAAASDRPVILHPPAPHKQTMPLFGSDSVKVN